MELAKLPEEMLELIAKYLSLEDICSCSMVSLSWRNAFNNNRIWKRFSRNSWYFDGQFSKLNYETDEKTLEECENKQRALKIKFIEDNMFNGNYIVEEVYLDSLYCDSIYDFADSAGNHWLFVSCMEGSEFHGKHIIQVWNLNHKPYLHTMKSTSLGGDTRLIESKMNVIKDKFYFINKNLLLVYKFAGPLYNLEYENKINVAVSAFYYKHYNADFSSIIRFLGNNVVSFFRTTYHSFHKLPPSFIAWNLESSVHLKGKDHICPTPDLSVVYHLRFQFSVEPSILEQILVPVSYLGIESGTKLLVKIFDVELLRYTDFCVEKPVSVGYHQLSLHKHTLCVMYYNMGLVLTAECYSIENNNILFNVCFSHGQDEFFHKLLSDAELIVFENNQLYLYNIFTNKELNRFRIKTQDHGSLTVLNESLILLECVTRTVTQEVWNVRTGQKLYTINLPETLGVQQYRHSHNYTCPPTVTIFKNPQMSYAHLNIKKNRIYVTSFW